MNIGSFLRRNAMGIVLLASFSGCSSLVVYPAFRSASILGRRSSCQANLKLIALACLQYQADYEGHYPPLSESGRGWSQILKARQPALKFSCREGYKPSFSPSSDYFFNAQLAGSRQSSVRDPLYTVAFGDGPDNGASNSHYWELPTDKGNENSPLQRHYGFGIYAFADGHVKLMSSKRDWGWMSNEGEADEWHLKFVPEESAFRKKRGSKKASVAPTPNSKEGIQDLLQAEHTFRTKN